MKKVTVRYARFLSPGSFVANDWTRPVDSTDPTAVEWPDNAYAFTLHEREDVIDGETVYEGKPRQLGGTYFHPDSTVEAIERVKVNPKATRVLLENMRINEWAHIVWTRWGTWPQPFDPAKDVVLAKPI